MVPARHNPNSLRLLPASGNTCNEFSRCATLTRSGRPGGSLELSQQSPLSGNGCEELRSDPRVDVGEEDYGRPVRRFSTELSNI
jgi:hypothetical protein